VLKKKTSIHTTEHTLTFAYPRRGKTRQSAPHVCARRLGQDEQYLTVREILSETSTLADGTLSRERSDFYRFGYATLGYTYGDQEMEFGSTDLLHKEYAVVDE
jgi:hypothetical protein